MGRELTLNGSYELRNEGTHCAMQLILKLVEGLQLKSTAKKLYNTKLFLFETIYVKCKLKVFVKFILNQNRNHRCYFN